MTMKINRLIVSLLSAQSFLLLPVAADFCCSWDFTSCGNDVFCNGSKSNCEGSCSGKWLDPDVGTPLGDYCCTFDSNTKACGPEAYCNADQSKCVNDCNGSWVKNNNGGGGPTPTAPNPTDAPVASPTKSGKKTATTTRYWDCSGGACGCAYLPFGPGTDNRPAHCHSNAMFAAPANNPHGAKFYGTAAVSQELFGYSTQWLGEGCGSCFKVTGTSNIAGKPTVETTLVLKAANLCPPQNPACSGNKVHFDIAAPGFDFTQSSFAQTCQEREANEKEAFSACEFWMINSQNPNKNCDCSKFESPVLEAGCNNFLSLNWNNPTVQYEAVECPMELDRLNCWEENGNKYPFGVPDFCESNVDGPVNPPAPTPPAPTPPAPTPPAPTPPAPTAPTPTQPTGPTLSGELTMWTNNGNAVQGSSCGYASKEATLFRDTWLDPYVKPKMYCAVSEDLFANGVGCGKCYHLNYNGVGGTDPASPGSANIQVVDSGAGGTKHFDCFGDAFQKLTGINTGVFPISYTEIDCDSNSDGVSAVVLDGNNAYYVKVLIAGGNTGVSAVKIKVGGTSIPMKKVVGATWYANLSGAKNVAISYIITFADGTKQTLSKCHTSGWPVATGSYCSSGGAPTPTKAPSIAPVWEQVLTEYFQDGLGAFKTHSKATAKVFKKSGLNSFLQLTLNGKALLKKALKINTYNKVRLRFHFRTYNVATKERFLVDYSLDGKKWKVFKDFVFGGDILHQNKKWYEFTKIFKLPEGSSTIRFRYRSKYPKSKKVKKVQIKKVEIHGL